MIGIASASSVMVFVKIQCTHGEHNTKLYTVTIQGYSTGFSVLQYGQGPEVQINNWKESAILGILGGSF